MELYIKRKGIDIWEIIKNGSIIVGKSEDSFTDDDYKLISKNSKAINILYCGLTVDICGSIFDCKSAKGICGDFFFKAKKALSP